MSNIFMLLDTPSGGGGTAAVDPASTATELYDESAGSARTNSNWKDTIGTTVGFKAGGGAASLFSQTQNSLEYYETDAAGSALYTIDGLIANAVPFSLCYVIKVRATGAASDEYQTQTGANANTLWKFRSDANIKGNMWIQAANGEDLEVTTNYAMNDNAWRIFFVTVNNVTSAGELNVYDSGGTTLTDTNASWTASNYNGALWAFGHAYGSTFAAWTGLAEMIFWRNKVLTLDEVNSYGTFLGDKWDISWTDNS